MRPASMPARIDLKEEYMDKKYKGYITKEKILHLYEDVEEMRQQIMKCKEDRNWSQICWINGVVFHNTVTVDYNAIYPEGTK